MRSELCVVIDDGCYKSYLQKKPQMNCGRWRRNILRRQPRNMLTHLFSRTMYSACKRRKIKKKIPFFVPFIYREQASNSQILVRCVKKENSFHSSHGIVSSLQLPDRPFHNFNASRSNFMRFRNVVRRISRLENCETVCRVVHSFISSHVSSIRAHAYSIISFNAAGCSKWMDNQWSLWNLPEPAPC